MLKKLPMYALGQGTAPVCIIPALKAGSSRLGHIATRGPTAEMLDICGILTSSTLPCLPYRGVLARPK